MNKERTMMIAVLLTLCTLLLACAPTQTQVTAAIATPTPAPAATAEPTPKPTPEPTATPVPTPDIFFIDQTPDAVLYESEALTVTVREIHYEQGGDFSIVLQLKTPLEYANERPQIAYAYDKDLDTYTCSVNGTPEFEVFSDVSNYGFGPGTPLTVTLTGAPSEEAAAALESAGLTSLQTRVYICDLVTNAFYWAGGTLEFSTDGNAVLVQ